VRPCIVELYDDVPPAWEGGFINRQAVSDDVVLKEMRKFSKERPDVSSNMPLTVAYVTPSAGIIGGWALTVKLYVPQDDCGPTGRETVPPEVPIGDPG
jgi:hypothetical protein